VDFAERDFAECCAIATDAFQRAVIAGHPADVLIPKSWPGTVSVLWALHAPEPLIGAVGSFRWPVLLRPISLHVSNAAISAGMAQAVLGKFKSV